MSVVVLQFSINQSSNRKYLIFRETTGAYSSVNTSGWGSPNRLTSDAETATLSVTTPAGSTFILNLFTSSFPTTNTTTQLYLILPENIGYTANTVLPDGEYTFVYTVARTTSVAFTYIQTLDTEIFGTIKCSVFGLYADIPSTDCGQCTTDAIDTALKGTVFLHGLEYAAATGLDSAFSNYQTLLTNLTINSNCKDC